MNCGSDRHFIFPNMEDGEVGQPVSQHPTLQVWACHSTLAAEWGAVGVIYSGEKRGYIIPL